MSELATGIGMAINRPSSRAFLNYTGIKPNQAIHMEVIDMEVIDMEVIDMEVIEKMFRTPSSGPKRGIACRSIVHETAEPPPTDLFAR